MDGAFPMANASPLFSMVVPVMNEQDVIRDTCSQDPRWKFIRLSRNFGYSNSITAGMLAAHGDAVMVIDADLQDPPELIPEFVKKWQEGYEIVYGVREKRVGEPR